MSHRGIFNKTHLLPHCPCDFHGNAANPSLNGTLRHADINKVLSHRAQEKIDKYDQLQQKYQQAKSDAEDGKGATIALNQMIKRGLCQVDNNGNVQLQNGDHFNVSEANESE